MANSPAPISARNFPREFNWARSMVVISIERGSFSMAQMERILKNRFGVRAPFWNWNIRKMGDNFIVKFPPFLLTTDNWKYAIGLNEGSLQLRRWSPDFGCLQKEKMKQWVLIKHAPVVCRRLSVLKAALAEIGRLTGCNTEHCMYLIFHG